MAEGEGGGGQPRAFPTLREARYARSLERGLAILASFSEQEPVLGAAELAQRLGMSRASTYRYARTLVSLGYLEHEPALGKYRLGAAVLDLGLSARNATGLCRHARPYMQQLARRSGATVELGVLDGPEVLLIERAPSTAKRAGEGKQAVGAGTRLEAHCTSLGKVLLASLPAERAHGMIAQISMEAHGPKTITSPRALQSQLEQVRVRGLAIEDEESGANVLGIAAPIREESGEVVAALSVTGERRDYDLQEMIDLFAEALQTSAAEISARLGWSGETD